MKLTIDTDQKTLVHEYAHGDKRELPLYGKEAFELISKEWLKVGWNQKYVYTFSWMGRPVIQLPEDLLRMQEAIFTLKPDVIVETGVAHGGSLIFYASLFKALERGRVIGVDIEIRPHNRKAIEEHALAPYITLVEGNSVAAETVSQVKSMIKPTDKVLVVLDSCHTREHVLAELEAYHDLVAPGSYIVATDGSMRDLYQVPRGKESWLTDNPVSAANDFLKNHPEFEKVQPEWPFNESELDQNVTHWPESWLRRKST